MWFMRIALRRFFCNCNLRVPPGVAILIRNSLGVIPWQVHVCICNILGPLREKRREVMIVTTMVLRSRPPFTGVLLGPGPESAPRSAFWAILGTCPGVPQRVLFECFLAFFGPKKGQKALKKHSLGHSEAGAQNCPKSTLWGTFRPGV